MYPLGTTSRGRDPQKGPQLQMRVTTPAADGFLQGVRDTNERFSMKRSSDERGLTT